MSLRMRLPFCVPLPRFELVALAITLAVVLVGLWIGPDKVKAGPQSQFDPSLPKIIEFDGCEYLQWWGRYSTTIHKGNCKNKFHGGGFRRQ